MVTLTRDRRPLGSCFFGVTTMSATLPPTADLERPSDFGEFWQQAEALPPVPSVLPEAEVPQLPPLTPEQHARRLRFRRGVSGVVLGLLAFTLLAACIYVVKGRAAEGSSAKSAAQAVAPPRSQPEVLAVAPVAPVAAPVPATVTTTPLSEADQALALASNPVATVANLQTWSRLASQLNPEDRQRVEHQLSRLSVTAARPVREAARLELALLWRATARRAKAQKVLVSLARTATDPVVKKYALQTLSSA
jgi:hypothetical protein